jgi:hypothetical protein
MIFNIVVVSPVEHWNQCKLLLESIDQHLVGYRIYLIDNTPELGLPEYALQNNQLYQIPWSDLISTRSIKNHQFDKGWIIQQLLKLAAHTFFKDEQYICLDSKNLILSNITTWSTKEFHILPQRYTHDFYKFYDSVCNLFDLEHLAVKPPQTPYILNSSTIKDLINFWGSWDNFQTWFTSFSLPSEFWLYDLWCQKHGTINLYPPYDSTTNILFLYNIKDWNKFLNSDKTKKYELASICRSLWEHPDFQSYKQDLNFLKLLTN